MAKIKIFSLGGLNENGKNTYVIEVDGDIYIFDCGLKYATGNMLGIDYIIPDFDYLVKNQKRIKGLFLTHGHYENMGAVYDLVNNTFYGNAATTGNDFTTANQEYITSSTTVKTAKNHDSLLF